MLYVSTIWMTTSNNQVWFYREKKIAEANIAFADRSDDVGLACLASVVGTYLLA